MWGFPYKFLHCLGGADLGTTILQEFKEYRAVWRAFEAITPKTPEQQKVARRSVWHKVSVKQLSAAVDSCGDELTTGVLEHCKHRVRLLLGTLPVEEIIGTQKKTARLSGSVASSRSLSTPWQQPFVGKCSMDDATSGPRTWTSPCRTRACDWMLTALRSTRRSDPCP